MKTYRLLILAMYFLLGPVSLFAGGLSTDWGEVVIDGLEPGKAYNINELARTPFQIDNNSDDEITIKVKILTPAKEELKPGYEPLTDTSWVAVEKDEIIIQPFKKGIINLKLTIPDEKKYQGKKYQFWAWSYTIGKAVGVGLKSRILIEIEK